MGGDCRWAGPEERIAGGRAGGEDCRRAGRISRGRRPEWIPFPCLTVAGQDTVDPRDNGLKAFS